MIRFGTSPRCGRRPAPVSPSAEGGVAGSQALVAAVLAEAARLGVMGAGALSPAGAAAGGPTPANRAHHLVIAQMIVQLPAASRRVHLAARGRSGRQGSMSYVAGGHF